MMNLQDHFKKHGLSAGEFAADCMGRDNQNGIQMTAMQDEVLSGEAFWNMAKNLIIQGATSSGKTLLADVVILYDGTVYRGAGTPERISLQTYNNFVGRAGRLGMRRTPNYYGESYLLTENLAYDYRMYTADKRTPIQSPFRPDRPDERVPYFLNWIGSADTAEERIEKGVQESFCYYFCM